MALITLFHRLVLVLVPVEVLSEAVTIKICLTVNSFFAWAHSVSKVLRDVSKAHIQISQSFMRQVLF